MTQEVNEKFQEIGESVFFFKAGLCFHKSFIKRFEGKSVIKARQMLKKNYTHSQQDDIISFLKYKKIIC
jgi:hypothetical protein